jgi:hypothetical protein
MADPDFEGMTGCYVSSRQKQVLLQEERDMPVMTKGPQGDDIVILSRKEYDQLVFALATSLIPCARATRETQAFRPGLCEIKKRSPGRRGLVLRARRTFDRSSLAGKAMIPTRLSQTTAPQT